ncbi:phosphate ABC transporter permease subunit PstC [Mycobacterium sp. 050128]|uniref:phosphate ABC transporter permease subunit PstC n=1 Tax=unclassified Mycobacterium TaxID=2642494 RepID=UPI002EDB24C3
MTRACSAEEGGAARATKAFLPDRPVKRHLHFSARNHRGDATFRSLTAGAAVFVMLTLAGTALYLIFQAWPALTHYGPLGFLTSDRWAPSEATLESRNPNPYGILQFVVGTLVTSAIALLIAVPVSIALGLYITDVAPKRMRRSLSSLVDLLAAIPSVVYGFWGVFALLPVITPIGTTLSRLSVLPVIGSIFRGPFFGYSVFSASIVLAIMVLPIVTAICREVFATAPVAEKEAALGLGATRWEMLRLAVIPRSRAGITGAAILGLGRAFGETIAVTMLIGNNVLSLPKSILSQGATMPSVIANEFTEANQPYHLDSLFVVASALLAVSLLVNFIGKWVVSRAGEHIA